MQGSASRGRLRPPALVLLLLALGSGFGAVAFAQDGGGSGTAVEDRIQALIPDLQKRQAELERLSRKVEQHEDRAAAPMVEKELSQRRGDFRRSVAELVKLVVSGEEAGVDVARGRAVATELLQKDALMMRNRLEGLQRRIFLELIDTIERGNPEETERARKELLEAVPATDRLVRYLKSNIEQREKLGLDRDADSAFLAELIQTRANVTAGLLQSIKSEISDISVRPGTDQDVEAQKTLATLRKQRDVLAESQRLNITLMEERGLQTAELRRGIISATGKISEDILDTDVASGLAGAWLADTAEWLRMNAASLVFQFLTFLLILFAFWVVARIARGVVRRGLSRSKLDISSLAQDFFIKTTSRLIVLMGFIIAIAQLGVEVAPLLAGLGIAGFVIGFALQDTLSNFASGLMILVYRPFDVGDVIEAGGVTGKVDQMNLVSTMILTFDNQLLVVPNKKIWGDVIRNVTHQDKRRVDLKFGIGYADDIPKAEKVLTDIVAGHEKVLKDPEPVIRLHELGESSVNFIVRPWAKTDDYWNVYWDVTREVKRRFDEEGISIPFPQRDVHLYRENGDA